VLAAYLLLASGGLALAEPVEVSRWRPRVIGPRDSLLIQWGEALRRDCLVNPDGTITLGPYGSVVVAGLTIDQATGAIAGAIKKYGDAKTLTFGQFKRDLRVDVLTDSSNCCYVIIDLPGQRLRAYSFPLTRNDKVLDALFGVEGVGAIASTSRVWVERRDADLVKTRLVMPVDWLGLVNGVQSPTNYTLLPGDRIHIVPGLLCTELGLAKSFAPLERLFGISLLGTWWDICDLFPW
jgi:polysaccharide export outer membrane protein